MSVLVRLDNHEVPPYRSLGIFAFERLEKDVSGQGGGDALLMCSLCQPVLRCVWKRTYYLILSENCPMKVLLARCAPWIFANANSHAIYATDPGAKPRSHVLLNVKVNGTRLMFVSWMDTDRNDVGLRALCPNDTGLYAPKKTKLSGGLSMMLGKDFSTTHLSPSVHPHRNSMNIIVLVYRGGGRHCTDAPYVACCLYPIDR